MKVISNSSPLVNLSRIGRLSILRSLYDEIVIPEAVYKEVVENGYGMPGSLEVSEADWIVVRHVVDKKQLRILNYDLDPGESEAIVLAIEENADLLIMDERMGREMARHLDLLYTGTLGALMDAKGKGIINKIAPILDELKIKAGFRISDALVSQIIKTAQED